MTTRPTDEEIRAMVNRVRNYWGATVRDDCAALLEALLTERQAARGGVTDEIEKRAAIAYNKVIDSQYATSDACRYYADDLAMRAALESIALPAGEVVVTKNEAGQIVAVTRQDEDGRVLEVIAEPTARPVVTTDKKIEEALDIFYGCIHWRGFGKQSLEGANGVKELMRNAIESAVHAVSIPDALGHSRSMVDSQYVEGWNACRETMLSASPQPQQAVPDGWTNRHEQVQRFALQRFIAQANDLANIAGQDKKERFFNAGSVGQFLADAKTAEECLKMLSAAPAHNGKKEGEG